MTLELQDLNSLPAALVNESYNQILQLIQEFNPTVDTKRGAIADLVLYLSSVLTAANQNLINLVQQSGSLASINTNPLLADETLVNNVASNYLTSRRLGTSSTGVVAIVLSDLHLLIVPQGSIFTSNTGLQFTADSDYIARTDSEDVLSSTDRLLVSLGNGTYIFTVNVVSVEIGSDKNLVQDTQLTAPPIDNTIVSCYAANSFVGGTNDETNTQLMARLASSISSKTLSNRPSIQGFIQALNLANYDNSFAISTVGYGDAEQQRYHSILPVAFGGRVDTYVRPQAKLSNIQIFKTATYKGPSGGNGLWQIAFNRDEAPGFYEVTRITLPADIADQSVTTFSISSDTRSYDLSTGSTSGLIYLPDVTKSIEAVYSRYQTAVIQFVDTITSTSGLVINTSTKSYGVVLNMVLGLADIQDAVSDPQSSYQISDCLIKATVPCYTAVTVNITKSASESSPDTSGIIATIIDTVNSNSFSRTLPVSLLTGAMKPFLSSTMNVTSVSLQGSVRRPNGTLLNLSSTSVLDIGNDTTNMITSKTTCFFIDENSVTVNVTNS